MPRKTDSVLLVWTGTAGDLLFRMLSSPDPKSERIQQRKGGYTYDGHKVPASVVYELGDMGVIRMEPGMFWNDTTFRLSYNAVTPLLDLISAAKGSVY